MDSKMDSNKNSIVFSKMDSNKNSIVFSKMDSNKNSIVFFKSGFKNWIQNWIIKKDIRWKISAPISSTYQHHISVNN